MALGLTPLAVIVITLVTVGGGVGFELLPLQPVTASAVSTILRDDQIAANAGTLHAH